jgi:hypothetical protein
MVTGMSLTFFYGVFVARAGFIFKENMPEYRIVSLLWLNFFFCIVKWAKLMGEMCLMFQWYDIPALPGWRSSAQGKDMVALCTVHTSVADSDPVGSALFWLIRIRIGIRGLSGSGSVLISTKCTAKLCTFSRKLKYTVQNIENYDKDPQHWCIHLYNDQYILIHICFVSLKYVWATFLLNESCVHNQCVLGPDRLRCPHWKASIMK